MGRESKSDQTRQRGPFNQRNRFQASVWFPGGGTQCAQRGHGSPIRSCVRLSRNEVQLTHKVAVFSILNAVVYLKGTRRPLAGVTMQAAYD